MTSIPGTQWIFVDDGSTDRTSVLCEAACARSSAHTLRMQRNSGKSEAVRAGLVHSLSDCRDTDLVGFMDADGAFASGDVARLIAEAGNLLTTRREYDSLWSSRVALSGRNIERSAKRHYMGRIAATVLSWNSSGVPYDTQSGFKLFAPTDSFAATVSQRFQTRWLFEMEILVRFQLSTGRAMRVWEEPLYSWRDVPGSKVSAKEVLRIGREILKVKRLSRRASS